MLRAPLLGLMIALTPFAGVSAAQGLPPISQPATYRSASGEFELYVEPTRRDGGGPANYRMSRSGELLWEKELYVTLWDAVVDEEGHTAGYAYSNGFRDKRAQGCLHIVLLDAEGDPILDEVTQRVHSRQMHSWPEPRATQLFLEGDLARMRVLSDDMPFPWRWRTYSISTGIRLLDLQLSEAEGRAVPWSLSAGQLAAREKLKVSAIPAPSLIQLEKIKTTQLVPDEVLQVTPIRDVQVFRLTEDGAIEFVRGRGATCVYVTLAKTGEVVAEQALPDLRPANGSVSWYPGHGDTWFAVARDRDGEKNCQLHRVNVRTGEHQSIDSFTCPKRASVVSTNDGGFVVFGETRGDTTRACMMAVDAADNVLWRQDEQPGSYKDKTQFFAADSAARTSEGFLVVLSTSRDSVQVFTAGGAFVRYIDLEKSWGYVPARPSSVWADERGGFVVRDDNDFLRMTLEGELVESWQPESTHDSTSSQRGVHFTDDGTMWHVAGDLFVSRKADGTRGASFGTPTSEQVIEKPNRAWIDRKGQVYIHDRRTDSWHVFDSTGKVLAILTPPDALTTNGRVNEHPTLGADGRWYVPLEIRGRESGHYEFSSSGEPLQHVQLGGGHAQMRGVAPGAWCVVKFTTELALVHDGKTLSELLLRPDRRWFRRVADFHVSADGSTLAVLDGWDSVSVDLGSVLCLYDGDGNAKFALDLPDTFNIYRVATTGRWAVATNFSTGVLLIDFRTNEIRQVELEESKNSWRWSFSPDGRELWGVEISALRLHRFALPKD